MEDAGIIADNPDKKFLDSDSEAHIARQGDWSYSAMFPSRDDHPPLPDDYRIFLGRTCSLMHRLAQSPGMLQTYDQNLKDQVNWGFVEPVKSYGSGFI